MSYFVIRLSEQGIAGVDLKPNDVDGRSRRLSVSVVVFRMPQTLVRDVGVGVGIDVDVDDKGKISVALDRVTHDFVTACLRGAKLLKLVPATPQIDPCPSPPSIATSNILMIVADVGRSRVKASSCSPLAFGCRCYQ